MWSLKMSVILSSAASEADGKATQSSESGWERHGASLKQASFVGSAALMQEKAHVLQFFSPRISQ